MGFNKKKKFTQKCCWRLFYLVQIVNKVMRKIDFVFFRQVIKVREKKKTIAIL